MRNPDRIDIVLQALGEAWRKSPDLRLTQLLVCCVSTQRSLGPNELFYIEGDETLDGINSFLGLLSICQDNKKDTE